MKTASLVSPVTVTLSDFVQVSPSELQFSVRASETSPHLWLENTESTRGWFSDNNFVAEKDREYTLTYKAFDEGEQVRESDINVRVL